MENEDKQNEMKDNIAKFAKPNAAEDIVDQIEMIINKR
jgi:UDP-N-acetylglucosamine:LPS N-acetylglucosamine transferase